MCFHAFGQCLRLLFIDKTLQKPEASHNWKQNWKTPTGSFLLPLLFGQMVEKLLILSGSYCNISAYAQHYELKFSIRTNFDTLISILTHMSKIKSLWRYDDVIFEKSVKRYASSAQIHIFIDPVSQIIFFLVDISIIAYFFTICVKKGKIF